MSKRDYYDVLGISKNATDKEIKSAYRKLAKKYHPDTAGGDEKSKKKFEEIGEAYSVLSDPEKRKLYDSYGFAAFDNGGDASSSGGKTSYNNSGFDGYRTYYSNFSTDSGDINDIFGDLFGGMFGGARSSKKGSYFHFDSDDYGDDSFWTRESPYNSYSQKSLDVSSNIDVSFDDAALGAQKRIQIHKENGQIATLQVKIPAGIEDGKSIRLKGKGNSNGNLSGDLYLKVHIMPKEGFERRGIDVYTVAKVPFTTAVFGGEIKVETLYGSVMCKVPKGMQSGAKIRLKGKGIPSMEQKEKIGDHYVTIEVIVPRNLSKEACQKLREFEKIAG